MDEDSSSDILVVEDQPEDADVPSDDDDIEVIEAVNPIKSEKSEDTDDSDPPIIEVVDTDDEKQAEMDEEPEEEVAGEEDAEINLISDEEEQTKQATIRIKWFDENFMQQETIMKIERDVSLFVLGKRFRKMSKILDHYVFDYLNMENMLSYSDKDLIHNIITSLKEDGSTFELKNCDLYIGIAYKRWIEFKWKEAGVREKAIAINFNMWDTLEEVVQNADIKIRKRYKKPNSWSLTTNMQNIDFPQFQAILSAINFREKKNRPMHYFTSSFITDEDIEDFSKNKLQNIMHVTINKSGWHG